MIVDTGKKRHRVQVKSTSKAGEAIDVQFMTSAGGKKKRRYTKTEVDFIALYISTYDAWYLFPIEDVETGVTIRPHSRTCKYRQYLEAWGLLK